MSRHEKRLGHHPVVAGVLLSAAALTARKSQTPRRGRVALASLASDGTTR